MNSEFFNPADCEFEVLGFFEELIDVQTHKVLGTRRLETPTRKLGSDGMIEFDITQNTVVQRGHKDGLIKASPEKPVRVTGILNVLCGRHKSTIPRKQTPPMVEAALRAWEEAHRVWMNTPVHQNAEVKKAMDDARSHYEKLFDNFQNK